MYKTKPWKPTGVLKWYRKGLQLEMKAEYYGKHDYSPGDYDTYSQDPEWRNLMRKAYPEVDLPELAISQEEAANIRGGFYPIFSALL